MVSHGVSVETIGPAFPFDIWVAKCKDCGWKAASPTKNGIDLKAEEHMNITFEECQNEDT